MRKVEIDAIALYDVALINELREAAQTQKFLIQCPPLVERRVQKAKW